MIGKFNTTPFSLAGGMILNADKDGLFTPMEVRQHAREMAQWIDKRFKKEMKNIFEG